MRWKRAWVAAMGALALAFWARAVEGGPRRRGGSHRPGPARMRDGWGQGGRRGPGEARPPRARRGLGALDADGDGEISAEEMANADAALEALDTNGNGQVTRDELMPDRPDGAGPGRMPTEGGKGRGGFRRPDGRPCRFGFGPPGGGPGGFGRRRGGPGGLGRRGDRHGGRGGFGPPGGGPGGFGRRGGFGPPRGRRGRGPKRPPPLPQE